MIKRALIGLVVAMATTFISAVPASAVSSVPGCFNVYITYSGTVQYVRLVNNCNIENRVLIKVSNATDRCSVTFKPYQGYTYTYGWPIRYQGLGYC